LSDWLDAVTPTWGYRIESFRIEGATQPGLGSARFALRS